MLFIWIYYTCSIHVCIWTLHKWFYLWHYPVCMEIFIIHIVWIIDVYTYVKIFTLVSPVSDSMMLLVHIFHIYCNICTRHICDIYVTDIYVTLYVCYAYHYYMSSTSFTFKIQICDIYLTIICLLYFTYNFDIYVPYSFFFVRDCMESDYLFLNKYF